MKVMARQPIEIIGEDGEIDNDLELRVVRDDDDQYIVKAFYFGRYIHEDIYSYHAYDDMDDAISTMRGRETSYHLENPDYIGNTDKFDIRCA